MRLEMFTLPSTSNALVGLDVLIPTLFPVTKNVSEMLMSPCMVKVRVGLVTLMPTLFPRR